jgi:hypothetical protein
MVRENNTWSSNGNIHIYRDFLSAIQWKGDVKESDKDKTITVIARSVMSLKEFISIKKGEDEDMDYDAVEKLILHIGFQIMVLENYGKGVFFFNLEDIVVIDHSFFLLGNLDHVLQKYKQDKLLLSYPMKFTKADEMFLPPELNKGLIDTLPFYASVTGSYYSLAKICIYCLDLGNDDYNLEPIKGSKMYFFLLRCLQVEPEDRYFLYI